MLKPLLIEIGVEELPAVPLLKELAEIEKKWVAVLEKNALIGEFEFYYTPRRLVLWHREFKTRQDDRVEEFFGAPVEIAIKDGVPTPAALGFAKKCGVEFDQISRAEKGGKEVLYFSKTIAGQESTEILGEMIDTWIKSLSFGKSMRWGSSHESFIRPIRWVNVTLGETLVDVELFGVRSASETYVHRISHFEAKKVNSIHHYFDLLKEGSVDLYPQSRRESILANFAALEREHGIKIEIDEDLLDEVVAITEHPTPLLGSFDESFLELPPEVIITSMKEHQRYFPVFKEGKLINAFIVVSNALTDDFSHVIEGNQRVLRPRLSDALFFYRNDLKKGLSTAGLEKVVFMNGLGTLAEKIKREKVVASTIANLIYDNINPDHLDRAMELAKADLMSEMVYEFTELQGLMGYYYALALGESAEVATAIKEQYLPTGEESALPSTILSAIVAMSMKLDTLIGMFSIGEIPTGSRDPFALRRAVNGIIKISVAHQIPLNFSTLIDQLSDLYPQGKEYKKNIETFIIERLAGAYVGVNPSVIQSVVVKELIDIDLDILEIDRKIRAVNTFVSSASFVEIFQTFKRVGNILKDKPTLSDYWPNENLLVEEAEKVLYNKSIYIIRTKHETYEERLDALFSLKEFIDTFFNQVRVNDDNIERQDNRKMLVGMIYREIYKIADIKNITI